MARLSSDFPFRDVFQEFLKEYAACSTYWYVPKWRTLTDNTASSIASALEVIDRFREEVWNQETQDQLLVQLIAKGVLDPYKPDGSLQDRTALIRICKKLLEVLGLLWVQEDKGIVVTDAGKQLIVEDEPRRVIENQVAKLQYPNPSLSGDYKDDFAGILPHLFLLQVLQKCSYRVSYDEYELFLNLANDQDDLERIVRYILCWRDLTDEERQVLLNRVRKVAESRWTRVHQSSGYQRALFAYASYLELAKDDGISYISCNMPGHLDALVEQKLKGLKIATFDSKEDWFDYIGDPAQEPSWFTYLSLEVEKAATRGEAEKIVQEHREALSEAEAEEIERKQVEKGIETFYAGNLHLLEAGLGLLKQQYSTPIGRIDLLCKSGSGQYVVVEVKADEANDSVFGQILRYMGWVHRNLDEGENNVRGIILASKFSDKARYSRIGLLKQDYKTFIGFKEHGLHVSDT